MWEPPAPEDRNGEIIGYSLHCWEACNNTQFVLGTNETLTSTATTFDLLCLIPNTYYNCTLSALTSIGEGPKISQLISTSFEGTNDSTILLHIEINAPVYNGCVIHLSLFLSLHIRSTEICYRWRRQIKPDGCCSLTDNVCLTGSDN